MQDNNKQKTSFIIMPQHPIFTFMRVSDATHPETSAIKCSTYPRQSTEFYGFPLKPHQSSFCPVLLLSRSNPHLPSFTSPSCAHLEFP